eukprot:scaffold11567_cov83-Skeletonema_dohrnii-CCMP3373.AAC.1
MKEAWSFPKARIISAARQDGKTRNILVTDFLKSYSGINTMNTAKPVPFTITPKGLPAKGQGLLIGDWTTKRKMSAAATTAAPVANDDVAHGIVPLSTWMEFVNTPQPH